ncbi:MAG: TetR/AcrR family transcriptional regulator [Anaerolineae bacterium]|nr:TetR/AcrR family transcriptional regulator [Anaerolineae bacterium]
MPRPREFDRETVLDKAMLLFWAQGYEATSVRDLTAATGISSSSMYEFFGDKRAIFLAALERYCQIEQAGVAQIAAAAASPQEFVETLFASISSPVLLSANIRGSFSFNAMVELGMRDPDVTTQLVAHFYRIADIIAVVVRDGQTAGTVTSAAAPADLAQVILTSLQGVFTVNRLMPDYPYHAPITRLLNHLLDS